MKWTSVALKSFLSFAAVATLALNIYVPKTYAASASAPFTAGAKVSFTFDDGLTSALAQAAPVLDKYGFLATEYVTAGCVGMVTMPNTCQTNPNASYLTWEEISRLSTSYGWEIASHTINDSQAELAAHGISATDFANPYSEYSSETIRQIAKFYASHRTFADQGMNSFPYNDYLLTVRQVQGDVSLETVKGYIDQAKAEDSWLILAFHDIKADDDPTYNAAKDAYQYKVGDLDQIAAYVQSQNIPVTDIAHGLANSKTNLFANGWVAGDPERVTFDEAGNGSYDGTATGATYSISLTGAEKGASLFSPEVTVDPSETYVLKSYVDVLTPGGEVDFFIDEYDADGNWLCSRYHKGVRATADPTVRNVNFLYKPTSLTVAKMSLQVVAYGTATATYIDNVQMFPLSDLTSADIVPEEKTEEPAPAAPTGGSGAAAPSQTAILATSVAASETPAPSQSNGQVKSATTTNNGTTPDNATKPANTIQNKAAAVNSSKIRKGWLWAVILLIIATILVIIRSRRVPAEESVFQEEPDKKPKP